MKKTNALMMIVLVTFSSYLISCTKSAVTTPNSTTTETSNPSEFSTHKYGLIPMPASKWANVPTYKSETKDGNQIESVGAIGAEVLPTSCLLLSPVVRDQGQIGSCTGFCGSETNEILKYYKANPSIAPIKNLNSQTGIMMATSNHILGITTLSPLFLYYVERCVLWQQPISSDPGAYMQNICEALQGLNVNSGQGIPLKLNGKIFKGECAETLYPYPTNATTHSTQFLTPPTTPAITNAPSYAIGNQFGPTFTSNTFDSVTKGGYFVITTTGKKLIADIKDAIFNKKPVMMGFNIYDNATRHYFEGFNTTNYTYNPLNVSGTIDSGLNLMGGHAVPIIGYLDDATKPGGGLLIVQNSWGTGWGFNGYFYMPYSVLQSQQIVPVGNLFVAI